MLSTTAPHVNHGQENAGRLESVWREGPEGSPNEVIRTSMVGEPTVLGDTEAWDGEILRSGEKIRWLSVGEALSPLGVDCLADPERIPDLNGSEFRAIMSSGGVFLCPAWAHFHWVPQMRNRLGPAVLVCSDGIIACVGHRCFAEKDLNEKEAIQSRLLVDAIDSIRFVANLYGKDSREIVVLDAFGITSRAPGFAPYEKALRHAQAIWELPPLPPTEFFVEGGYAETELSLCDVCLRARA